MQTLIAVMPVASCIGYTKRVSQHSVKSTISQKMCWQFFRTVSAQASVSPFHQLFPRTERPGIFSQPVKVFFMNLYTFLTASGKQYVFLFSQAAAWVAVSCLL